jgi:hypothetical protein
LAREVPHTASGSQWIPSNHALKKLPAISLGIRLFPVSSNWLPFSLPRRRDWVRPGRALARESVACVCACALPPPRCMHIADEVCCLGRAAERSRRPPGAGSYSEVQLCARLYIVYMPPVSACAIPFAHSSGIGCCVKSNPKRFLSVTRCREYLNERNSDVRESDLQQLAKARSGTCHPERSGRDVRTGSACHQEQPGQIYGTGWRIISFRSRRAALGKD